MDKHWLAMDSGAQRNCLGWWEPQGRLWVCSPAKAAGAGSEAAVCSQGCPELPSLSQHPRPRMLHLQAGAER